MHEAHMDLRNDLVIALNMVAGTFNKTSANVRILYSLLNDTTLQIEQIFLDIQQSLNALEQRTRGVRLLSVFVSKYLQLWSQQVTQYQNLLQEADELLAALHELKKGYLSPLILNPKQLKHLIKNANQGLAAWDKSYKFLFHSLSQFYLHSQPIFWPSKRGLLIQLIWPIYPSNGRNYQMFKVSSIHVPVNPSGLGRFNQSINYDYTKIVIEKPYFAVSDRNIIELTDSDLRACYAINNQYYCYTVFIEIDKSPLTCLSAIYLNSSVSNIVNLCDVDYYMEPFRPPPSVIDVGDYLLISELSLPWRYQCDSQRIPTDIPGSLYAIVRKESLCHCSISSVNGFIPRRLANCRDNSQPLLHIAHVMNTLAVSSLASSLNMTNVILTRDLLRAPSEIIIPKLDLNERVRNAKLYDTTEDSIKLKKLAKLITKKGDDFANRWNEIATELNFMSWFSRTHWPKAVTFAGAICGYLSLLLGLYLFLKGCYSNGLIKSMVFASVPQLTKAFLYAKTNTSYSIPPEVSLDDYSLALITLSHLIVAVLVSVLVMTIRRLCQCCCREASIMVTHPTLKRHPRVELYLELHSGHERVLLYLMTVKAHVSRIHFEGNIVPESLQLDNHTFYSVLRINWSVGKCALRLHDIKMELTPLLQVPMIKRAKLQAIMSMKPKFQCFVLAVDGLYYYRLGDNTHSVIPSTTVSPYTELIRELQEKEKEFVAAKPSASVIATRADVDAQPSTSGITTRANVDNQVDIVDSDSEEHLAVIDFELLDRARKTL
jgi:hypothetical protein